MTATDGSGVRRSYLSSEQAFRVVSELEHRYPAFPGLNLTWETLEGVVKHNGPVSDMLARPEWSAIVNFNSDFDLDLGGRTSAEAQVAALSDDIAYNNHDVDDGLRAGLFTLQDLTGVPLVGPILIEVRSEFPTLDDRLLRLETVRRMIGLMVDDVLRQTEENVAQFRPASSEDVRQLDRSLVSFSASTAEQLARLRLFLHSRMYSHPRVLRVRGQAQRVLADLFEMLMEEPTMMPERWRVQAAAMDERVRYRVICDYIAGMTDRYALSLHRTYFGIEE